MDGGRIITQGRFQWSLHAAETTRMIFIRSYRDAGVAQPAACAIKGPAPIFGHIIARKLQRLGPMSVRRARDRFLDCIVGRIEQPPHLPTGAEQGETEGGERKAGQEYQHEQRQQISDYRPGAALELGAKQPVTLNYREEQRRASCQHYIRHWRLKRIQQPEVAVVRFQPVETSRNLPSDSEIRKGSEPARRTGVRELVRR